MDIKVTRTTLPPFEEYCEAIRPLWESHWLTNMGPFHEELETALQQRLGCRVTLFSSGHLALEAALSVCDLPPGSEVITTPFTFVSTVHAIVRCGLKPVFCDVRAEDGTLDPACAERLITPRTSAILPVHVYGNVCDVTRLEDLARRHGLKLVFDAAHAFLSDVDGVPAVRFGDASALSFHATKVFSTGEGGAVCYRDPALRQRLQDQRNFGIRDREHCASAGGNAKMSELHAVLGLCNLRHLSEAVRAREAAAALYRKELVLLPEAPQPFPSGCPNFPVLYPSAALRDAAALSLEKGGVDARKYFWPLVSDTECYRGMDKGDTPVARDLASRILALPLYPELTPAEIRHICSLVFP